MHPDLVQIVCFCIINLFIVTWLSEFVRCSMHMSSDFVIWLCPSVICLNIMTLLSDLVYIDLFHTSCVLCLIFSGCTNIKGYNVWSAPTIGDLTLEIRTSIPIETFNLVKSVAMEVKVTRIIFFPLQQHINGSRRKAAMDLVLISEQRRESRERWENLFSLMNEKWYNPLTRSCTISLYTKQKGKGKAN